MEIVLLTVTTCRGINDLYIPVESPLFSLSYPQLSIFYLFKTKSFCWLFARLKLFQ